MQPKVRIWIDARKEKKKAGEIKELRYEIKGLQNQDLLKQIYEAIGYRVLSIAIDGSVLLVTYETDKINPTFIDYLLNQRGIDVKRQDYQKEFKV